MIAGALLFADLGVRTVAEDRMASRLASSVEGERGLEVDIGGAFFVPQVFSGEFDSITLSADSVRRDGLALKDVDIRMRSLELSLSHLLDGEGVVTVAGGRGSGVITPASLEAGLRRRGLDVQVDGGDSLTITSSGVAAEVEDASVDGGVLTLSAAGIDPVTIELPDAPAGVDYAGVELTGGRLVLELSVPEGTLEL